MLGLFSLFVVGLAVALPVEDGKPRPTSISTTDRDCPQTLCVDGVNPCGTKWGGCYDVCQPTLKPTMPPCETETPPITTTTSDSISIISEPTVTDCSSQTVCWDAVNECGKTYGGCFSLCTPWPTFTPPPCDETTTTTPPTTTSSSSSTKTMDDCSSRTVCADYINECGMMYGGCFPDCSPWPTFTPPPCPTTTITGIEARATTDGIVMEDCMTQTVCVDMGNECGVMFGSCFPNCKPWPTLVPPPCPDNSATTTTGPSTTDAGTTTCMPTSSSTSSTSTTISSRSSSEESSGTGCSWLCVDYVNDCGRWYGGCFESCPGEPWPEFEDPGCPESSSTS